MKSINKIKEYLSEQVIRLLLCHVAFIILTGVFTTYCEHYYNKYHEKPARAKIANLENKRILANIVQQELLLIESNYRAMLLSKNTKHLEILNEKIIGSINICTEILNVLNSGGTFINIHAVNFYDKDEFVQTIKYTKPTNETIAVEAIDLHPRLVEIRKLVNSSLEYLTQMAPDPNNTYNDNYELVFTAKQMESYLLRSREIANKIYYDIKLENDLSEQQIRLASDNAIKTLVMINIFANSMVIILAILIAIKIANILHKQRVASATVNTILENLPFGIVIVNKDKIITKINKTGQEIIGRTDEDVVGKVCHNIICPTKTGRCPVIDLKQKINKAEKYVMDGKGNKIPVLKTAIPLELDGEEVILEAFTDISEQKKMQDMLLLANENIENHNQNLEKIVTERTRDLQKTMENLKEAQGQLLQSEKMASVGQLAAGIAHEINNPIGFIKSNLYTFKHYAKDIILLIETYDRLLKSSDDNMSVADKINTILEMREKADIDFVLLETVKLINDSIEGVDRITHIVTDLKDFSHIDRPNACEEDINVILDKTISVAWNEIKYKAKVIRNYGSIPLLKCHGGQLGQVFLNMLINATHALDGIQDGIITVKTYTNADSIIVEISDNGCGISPEIIPKIFDPFFTTKDIGKGTGLGLNLAYKIIELHNGKIHVESTPGVSTKFTIELPLSEPISNMEKS